MSSERIGKKEACDITLACASVFRNQWIEHLIYCFSARVNGRRNRKHQTNTLFDEMMLKRRPGSAFALWHGGNYAHEKKADPFEEGEEETSCPDCL